MTDNRATTITFADWAEALRNPGDRKQIRHSLHSGKGRCCLGILGEDATPGQDFGGYGEMFDGRFAGHALGDAAARRLFEDHSRLVPHHTFVDLNDSLGKSFAEIADIIEERATKRGIYNEPIWE